VTRPSFVSSIQKTSQRQLNAVLAQPRYADAPDAWGQWVRDRHYSLEVSQHPIRARMCGFGDKDRRPLAPAAVAKMIVRREDNSLVDTDDVDIDFFVVTVDLWSADGREEMNLVLHPSSADRYLPAHLIKPRKPRGITIPEKPAALVRSSRPYPNPSDHLRSPTNHTPGDSARLTLRPIDPMPPLLTPASTTSYTSYPFSVVSSDPWSTDPSWSFAQTISERTFSAPTLPSIHALQQRSHSLPPGLADLTAYDAPEMGFRNWNDMTPSLFDTTRWSTNSSGSFTLPSLDPWASQAMLGTQEPQPPTPPAPAPPPPPPAPTQQHAYQPFYQDKSAPQASSSSRHTYTRTLVGPLSASAQRLQDEHRKPGIFFLFQDLSIRTEGTFRLRMRLMNVGEPPAPNGLSNAVHTGVSPVLAQAFSEPFTVYSAKRFPGVPDTTALSIAFGNQGQKLPLRNRHGTGKSGRRARRPGDASSDEDSS